MSNTKHTNEPWYKTVGPIYGNRTIKQIESDAGQYGTVIAQREVYVDGDEYDQSLDRAVACVNALAGIEDPATYIATLKAQRDDLLEACRSANGDMKWAEREANANFRSSIILCDAAIANATK